jgi:hypothetical protein
MSRELLLARIGDQLHVIGQERERAANILLQWVVARLKFDQSIRIKEIGVFQLKKEPLPRVDRKTSDNKAVINKRTLIYSPLQDEKSKSADPVFISFDLDELNIDSSDYLEKVFSLNVDKPLIPVKEDSSHGFESKVFGEDTQETVAEKIEALVKDGELLENFNIFENYLHSDSRDNVIGEFEEDDLVKEELMQSMEDDLLDDIQVNNESDDSEDDENNNLTGVSIIEEEIMPDTFDEDKDGSESDISNDSDIQDLDLLDSANLNELNTEEEDDNTELPEEDGPIDILDDLNSGSDKTMELDFETEIDKEERITQKLDDSDLDVTDEAGHLSSNLELDEKEQDILQSDSVTIDDLDDVEKERSDELAGDEFSKTNDAGDIEPVEELIVESGDDSIGEYDFKEESLDTTEYEKPENISKKPEDLSKQELPPKENGIKDEIKDEDSDYQGTKGDLFAQLEDYLKEDTAEESQPAISSDAHVDKDEDLKLTEEFSEKLPVEKKKRKKERSGKTAGILIFAILVVIAGAVSIYVFDFWDWDNSEEIVSPSSDENIIDTEHDLPGKEISEPAADNKIADQVQDADDSRTGLYRDIANEKQITSQIYFDGTSYTVQVSSWKNKTIAEKEVKRLRAENFDAFIYRVYLEDKDGTWNRVRIGYFSSRKEAEDFIRKNKF